MQTWKLTLAYDGTAFHGWQVQPGLPTIQGTLAEALHRMTGESVLPQGSGRTDAGVHALGQVASFNLEAPIPPERFHRALNHALPSSIRVLSTEIVADTFHARHSAVRKTYEYRIFPRKDAAGQDRICSPFLAPFVWDCPLHIDLHTMQQAAMHIAGTHDFTSFAARDPDSTARLATEDPDASPISPVRTIDHSQWSEREGLLVYRVTGSGFLHHMVRNLVGTCVEVGSGRIPSNSIPSILAARDRSAAGPTAPASGLFLVEVEY